MTLRQSAGGSPVAYATTSETAKGTAAFQQTNVRNGPVTLYSVMCINNGADADHADAGDEWFLKLYDSDGDGLTYGTTAPDFIIPIIGGLDPVSAADEMLNPIQMVMPGGIAFATGLSYAVSGSDGVDTAAAIVGTLNEVHLTTN